MSKARWPYLTSRLQGFGTTVFAETTRLATLHNAINLGQGFPDFDGPEHVKQAAIDAISSGKNQYCRTFGIAELNRAIADHHRRFYGLTYDPDTEITVYSGATEAIFATLQAVCEVGDEVILFEPFYDSYRASIAMAGAVERVVTLRAPSFSYDANHLASSITAKTRAILLNSPHNPTGKVFRAAELEHIASLCREHDLLMICDEVYEHLVYEGEHVPIATLPGMKDRTIVISSSGKTFSFTGWKIGFSCAPEPITRALRCAHQFITFCSGTPFQYAIATAFASDDDYYAELTNSYRTRRDRLCRGLAELGFGVIEPAGTYFIVADVRPLGFDDDMAFCRMLPAKVGVAAIPTSAFCLDKDQGRHLVRFAFCKSDAMLEEALLRLQRLRT